MKKHLLFLGPPGAGKGTQSALLSEATSYLHLSTGELLRNEVELGTDLGKKVRDVMNKGKLVSDQLVLEIVKKNLKKVNQGWILDGYPRNLLQVKSLNDVLANLNQPLDIVFYLDIPDEVLIKRLLMRGRNDDNVETIKTRLKIYKETTEPLVEYYKKLSLLEYINADGDFKTISEDIKQKMA